MPQRSRLYLNVWLNTAGSHPDSWNLGSGDRSRIFTLDHYVRTAETARRGVFDAVFLADQPQLSPDPATRPEYPIDPLVLLTAVTTRVPDIGAIVTASTSFSLPYTIARQIGSANLLSGGRVGWNAVTTFRDVVAANYGGVIASHDDRYRRADEFVDVVRRLWESWRFDWDRAAERTGDPFGPAERIDHRGEFYDIAGPLNVPLAPSGPPVIAQAGGSPQGISLAGKHAELIYANLRAREGARRFVRQIRDSAVAQGRRPESILVVPSISPLIGSTEAEVARRVDEHEETVGGIAERIARLERTLGVELAGRDWDEPLDPADLVSDIETGWPVGVRQAIIDQVAEERLSLRGLAHASTGVVAGTPEQIADRLVDWWQHDAADGFTVTPQLAPDDLEVFVDHVVPILQARGVTRTSYEESSVRERFGLSPSGPYGSSPVAVASAAHL